MRLEAEPLDTPRGIGCAGGDDVGDDGDGGEMAMRGSSTCGMGAGDGTRCGIGGEIAAILCG